MFLSVVITNYNRSHLIDKAIQSCLTEFAAYQDYEIIIVDDASQDNSVSNLKSKYKDLVIHALPQNLGVTGAKNAGFKLAQGRWVMFLDSDDYLQKQSGSLIYNELKQAAKYSIVFFRCIDQNNQFVGVKFDENIELNITTYIKHTSFGEALAVMQKYDQKQTAPFVENLRGYEGIGCARQIVQYGPALLSKVIARVYDRSGDDRLSVTKGFLKRIHLVGKGHFIYLSEFNSFMDLKLKVSYLAKSIVFITIGCLYNFFRDIKS